MPTENQSTLRDLIALGQHSKVLKNYITSIYSELYLNSLRVGSDMFETTVMAAKADAVREFIDVTFNRLDNISK